jgi:hypothetical protein
VAAATAAGCSHCRRGRAKGNRPSFGVAVVAGIAASEGVACAIVADDADAPSDAGVEGTGHADVVVDIAVVAVDESTTAASPTRVLVASQQLARQKKMQQPEGRGSRQEEKQRRWHWTCSH